MSIVVIGASFVDIKGYPLTEYVPGGRNAGKIYQVHGGVARNVAEDISNAGVWSTFVTLVDETGMGEDVIERLKEHDVDVRYIRRSEDGLGTWLAVFDHTKDVVASISKRPDLSEILSILEEHGDMICRNARSIVVEMDLPSDILIKVYQLAEKYDKNVYGVISNMSLALENRELLEKIECIVCNEQEAELLFEDTYSNLTDEELVVSVFHKVKQTEFKNVVVTLGARGAVYADKNGEFGHCPAQDGVVVDTTGAGDAFFSGVVIGLTYGKTLKEACDIGNRLAASVIASKDNTCGRFSPDEFGIDFPAK